MNNASLMQQPRFLRFWMARMLAVMGGQMLLVALGWQMYDLTSSAWDLGLVGLFQFVPALVFTLPAGYAADRWRRGRIFIGCMMLHGAAALLLMLALWGGFVSRELILGICLALGVGRALQMPAQQALLPLLIPPALLGRAVALAAGGLQFAIVCGPALGGLLYVAGAAVVYGVCFMLFLAAAALLLGVRYVQPVTQTAQLTRTLFAGVAYVWRTRLLLGALTLDLFAVLLGGATALLPMYARDILHTGPEGLGLLRAAPAVGALAMSLMLMRHPVRRHAGKLLLFAVAVYGLATVAFGLSTDFIVSFVALVITGIADSFSVITRQTLVQVATPEAIRGRVSAVNSIFIGASNQLGEFESGATAALWGPVAAVVVGGIGALLVAALWWKWFPDLARRDRLAE